MGKVNTGKRTRLSGAQYMKKRNAKKSFIESQKGSISKFLSKQNELRSSDEESELSNNSVSNEVTINENISPSESNLNDVDSNMPCSSAEVSQSQLISQIFSTNDELNNIDGIEMAEAQAAEEIEDPTYEHGNASLNLTKLDSDIMEDPGKWPDINDNIRCFLIQHDPKQIKLDNGYPKDESGRQFSNYHYTRKLANGETLERPWLMYSTSMDMVYCFCCKVYNRSKSVLGSHGSCDWKNMSSILQHHEKSPDHLSSYHDWKELKMRIANNKTIDDLNQRLINREAKHWKDVLERIISLVRVHGVQNLPLRGQSDRLYTPHNGNFLKFVEVIAEFDPIMKEHIRRIKSDEIHDHYLGKNIQNEIIQFLSKKVKQKVINDLTNAKYYSIILDCTPDVSHKEQMTMIVRFVTANEATTDKPSEVSINEHFIGFVELEKSTGASMVEILLKQLSDSEICLDDMRGQGYDNGANMRGIHNGVQARVRELNRRAFFVPCNAHSLNLVVNDAVNCCLEAVTFFDLIQNIYTFFRHQHIAGMYC